MTRFSYTEYFSLFHSSGMKSSSALAVLSQCFDSGGRRGNLGDVTSISPEPTRCLFRRDVEPMIQAIRKGDVQTVSELAASTSCIQTQMEGWTALHEAAYWGQAGCVKALLKAKPTSVDKRTLQEQTALLIATDGKHLDCVKCLLEAGADPDISNKNKETPLYKACEQESIDIVRVILAFGGAVNQRCHRGWTALHEAVRRGNTELCETLLQAGAAIDPPSTYGITPLIEAAQHGRTKVVDYLIQKGAKVNLQSCEGTTALSEASKQGHLATVELLLRHHADANKASNTGLLPLHIAAQHGHKEIVSLLLPVTGRAKIRQSGITPLHLAAEFNHENVVSFLISSGSDVNSRLSNQRSSLFHDHRTTALYCAVAAGNAGVVDTLLKAGANPNLDPLSPLMVAVRQGCFRTISTLVEYGADVNARIPAHPTDFPGVLLCTHHLGILQYLLDNGCQAHNCFRCYHKETRQPYITSQSRRGDAGQRIHTMMENTSIPSRTTCTESATRNLQFCEWISSASVCHMAAPLISLLLDYVGNVHLCCRVTEQLNRKEEWIGIKEKALSPRPLMHLCRLKIREQVGAHRLKSLNTLPLPGRLLHYLRCSQTSTREYPDLMLGTAQTQHAGPQRYL
ncbi:ankyrin repeat and SOCS box protein 2b isoform X1 [Pygocentrus nattereri]|uniref:ankyrin repeat and SOCS box protein 2b isoform X1 n=1 Tax=Pygocentrus nattereri TaxID=42514 RepID=UPI0008145ABD|nr:ankyrin repeat and SOCS box protein 2b isoform X1 [Pygocentrus nattereri]